MASLMPPVHAITLAPTDKPLVTSSAHATMAARATTVAASESVTSWLNGSVAVAVAVLGMEPASRSAWVTV